MPRAFYEYGKMVRVNAAHPVPWAVQVTSACDALRIIRDDQRRVLHDYDGVVGAPSVRKQRGPKRTNRTMLCTPSRSGTPVYIHVHVLYVLDVVCVGLTEYMYGWPN